MRAALPVLLCLPLLACAPRAGVETGTPAPGALTVPVLVATTRASDPETGFPGSTRSPDLTFGRYEVAIPPSHQPGVVQRARGRQADPSRDFLLSGSAPLEAASFRHELAAALARQPQDSREVTIFVHGFNTTFIEGVYRVAQFGHDLELPGVLAHYSWPSRGAALSYVQDRDSVLFARDGLEQMIREAQAAGARKIILIGHSMGTQLVMETLRQMAPEIRAGRSPFAGVVLISPDLDVDLFRMQAERIGELPQPFVIFTSQRDRILRLSARVSGDAERLGNLTDPARLAGLDVTLVDVTAFSSGAGHFTLGESPVLIQLLSRMDAVDSALRDDASGTMPLLPGVLLTLTNTTQMILSPLSELGAELGTPLATGLTSGPTSGRRIALPGAAEAEAP